MSLRLYFSQLSHIQVGPVNARRHPDPTIGIYTTQTLAFHMEDGSNQEFILNLEPGMHALAVGELVTNEQVTA